MFLGHGGAFTIRRKHNLWTTMDRTAEGRNDMSESCSVSNDDSAAPAALNELFGIA